MKGQVYMACIRSCLLYGCDSWAMRAELEDEGPGLHGMHYKVLVVWVRFMGHESRAVG